MPRYVLPCAYTVVEQELHGDSVVPHWTNIREQGERWISTPSRESNKIKVRYVTRASFYNIVERREHGDIIGTV